MLSVNAGEVKAKSAFRLVEQNADAAVLLRMALLLFCTPRRRGGRGIVRRRRAIAGRALGLQLGNLVLWENRAWREET